MRFLRRCLFALVLAAAGVVHAQNNLPACGGSTWPYQGAGGNHGAQTPMGVCYDWAKLSTGFDWVEYGQGYCMLQNTSSGALAVMVVSKVCEPTNPHFADPGRIPGLSATQVQDYVTLFGLFLLAAVTVLGAKAIYKRFRVDYD